MRLYSYSTRAESVCRWPRFARDALVMGVEIECEPRGHASQSAILRALGDDESAWFCKSDGSLDSGVEIVTVPMTLAGHRDFDYRTRLAPILPLAMSGARTSHCGMHVHINRGALSPLTQAKVLLFVNAPVMQPLIVAVAQRGPNTFCRPFPKKWSDGASGYNREPTRYQAVNLTGKTAEFRIFRGSLRYDRILKNLEFCHAVVTFCRATSCADILRPDLFVAFVNRAEKDYPALAGFLAEIGFNPAPGGVA